MEDHPSHIAMDTRKLRNENGHYPPTPSIEDAVSANPNTDDFGDDCYELNEAYLQAFVENKRLREELGQEEGEEEEGEEAEGEESPQILIEYIPDAESSTISSTSSPHELPISHDADTAVYREHVVMPLCQHHPVQPRHHRALPTASYQARNVQKMPRVHQPIAPSLHRQMHQARSADHIRYPLPRCICAACDGADRPERFQHAHVLRRFAREPHGVKHSVVLPCCGSMSDAYFGHNYTRDVEGDTEAEVFEKFAEVFNAMRKIDADISALRKVLDGLFLDRFGGRR